MQSMSWFVPILPDKLDAWIAFTEQSNEQKEAHARSRRRAGITREVAALVRTPQGNFTSVFLEAEDVAASLKAIMTSDDPYDKWFMAMTEEVHGMTRDAFEGPLPSTVYFDYRDDSAVQPAEERRDERVSH